MKLIKTIHKVYLQNDFESKQIFSHEKSIQTESHFVDEFLLKATDKIKKYADNFIYLYFNSSYPIKVNIAGSGQLILKEGAFDFQDDSKNFSFEYINPGEDENIEITLIALRA